MTDLKLDTLIKLGFNTEEVNPRIFYIEDFATAEETQVLYDYATSRSEDDWRFRYLEEMKKSSFAKFGRDDIEALVDEGLLEVTWDFADKNVAIENQDLRERLRLRTQKIFDELGKLDVTGYLVIQRLYEGTNLKQHFDQYSDKLVQYAAVLYLNDDYSGGELFFPKKDFKIKPKPGSLVIFPGTEEFEHGVRKVGLGPHRYVIPVFIKSQHPDGEMSGWGEFG